MCVCIICKESVAVIKDYNVRRHHESKPVPHFVHWYSGLARDQVTQLTASLLLNNSHLESPKHKEMLQ